MYFLYVHIYIYICNKDMTLFQVKENDVWSTKSRAVSWRIGTTPWYWSSLYDGFIRWSTPSLLWHILLSNMPYDDTSALWSQQIWTSQDWLFIQLEFSGQVYCNGLKKKDGEVKIFMRHLGIKTSRCAIVQIKNSWSTVLTNNNKWRWIIERDISITEKICGDEKKKL